METNHTTEHDPLCDDNGWDHPGPCATEDEDNPTWGLTYGDSFTDEDSGTAYTPFIGRNGQVGYRCDKTDGQQTFIYLNASGGSDDGVATVFIYQDDDPDELSGAMHHYEVWS